MIQNNPGRAKSAGILTLHYGFNEGAVLQAMATCQIIRSLYAGSLVEVVDHRYPAKKAAYGDADTPREKAIFEAVKHWLPLSPACFISPDHESTHEYCSKRYRDLVIGSDVVWALRYVRRFRRWIPGGILPHQSDPFFPPFPNVYWPGEKVKCTKIAYAASCGNLDPNEIPFTHRKRMAVILDQFSGISVRDTKSLELVQICSPTLAERTVIVPDPTIAFDLLKTFDGSTGLEKLRASGYSESGPWALLVMKEGNASRMAIRAMKRQGYRVAATGAYGGEADIDLIESGLSPLEWGWVPRYFRLNVTERMHSCIFTVLNQTPLVALDMNRRVGGTKTKLEERMQNFGLEEFYLHQDDACEKTVTELIRRVSDNIISWNLVASRIEGERRTAQEFLSKSLAI